MSFWSGLGNRRPYREDDYNGELRCQRTAHPALQGMGDNQPVVYLGLLSKLSFFPLSVSVIWPFHRIWFGLHLSGKILNYNQAASKTEQLALASYIGSGQMERHLRRLRKLYGGKEPNHAESSSRGLSHVPYFAGNRSLLLFSLPDPLAEALVKAASVEGVRLRFRREGGHAVMVIGFAGVAPENIPPLCGSAQKAWGTFSGRTSMPLIADSSR